MRKVIGLKLENLPTKERELINEWASNQTNIQKSISNILMHIITWNGVEDVMGFDTQRRLYTSLQQSNAATTIEIQSKPDEVAEPSKDVENLIENTTDKVNIGIHPLEKAKHLDWD